MSTSVPPPGYEASHPSAPAGPARTEAAQAAQPSPGHPRLARAGAGAPAPKRRGRPHLPRPKLVAAGLAAIVAAGLAVFLSAPFGAGGLDPVARAAALSSSTPGYRMRLSIAMTAPGLGTPVSASGNGIIDLHDHAAALSLGFDLAQMPQAVQQLGTSSLRIGMIMSGGAVYMEFPPSIARALPGLGAKPWIKVDVTKLAGLPGLSSLSSNPTMSDPSRMLDYLRAASDSVTNQGQEQIDGVQTTHYRATIDPNRLPEALPAQERASVEQALSKLNQATGGQGLPVDVWIDASHLVRRMEMSISVHGSNGPALQESVVVNFSDYGVQSPPKAPPADQVQDLTSLVPQTS